MTIMKIPLTTPTNIPRILVIKTEEIRKNEYGKQSGEEERKDGRTQTITIKR